MKLFYIWDHHNITLFIIYSLSFVIQLNDTNCMYTSCTTALPSCNCFVTVGSVVFMCTTCLDPHGVKAVDFVYKYKYLCSISQNWKVWIFIQIMFIALYRTMSIWQLVCCMLLHITSLEWHLYDISVQLATVEIC